MVCRSFPPLRLGRPRSGYCFCWLCPMPMVQIYGIRTLYVPFILRPWIMTDRAFLYHPVLLAWRLLAPAVTSRSDWSNLRITISTFPFQAFDKAVQRKRKLCNEIHLPSPWCLLRFLEFHQQHACNHVVNSPVAFLFREA